MRLYRHNYFYSSLEDEIVLTDVCGKVAEIAAQTCQHSIVNFQKLKQRTCRWSHLSRDGNVFLERRVVVSRGLFTC